MATHSPRTVWLFIIMINPEFLEATKPLPLSWQKAMEGAPGEKVFSPTTSGLPNRRVDDVPYLSSNRNSIHIHYSLTLRSP